MKTAPQKEDSRYANTGFGPNFSVLDIGLPDTVAVIEADTAYWALVNKDELGESLAGSLPADFAQRSEEFKKEMDALRFGLTPSAAYFNPTERCNLNCGYCYLPEEMRRDGITMTTEELCDALERLLAYFKTVLPEGAKPQLIFHGSEPMVARESMFAGIEKYSDRFHFGVQTNATLLDDEAIAFLTSHGVGIGLSLDAPRAEIANITRKNWNGTGYFDQVVAVIKKLVDYPALNVITTVTSANVEYITEMVDFYHDLGVKVIMLNPVRCTRKGGMDLKPDNDVMTENFFKALDRTHELYEKTGRKMVVANFANILAGVIAPTGRRLMCDISPCGGGRCFFAVAATGDLFPCSEFIGFPEYNGGNLFKDEIPKALASEPFKEITGRKAEDIEPCKKCAIRHFCGAPCPAEVKEVSGTVYAPSPFCQFYEEQARYAFRVIAQGREDAYLWDGFDDETEETYRWA